MFGCTTQRATIVAATAFCVLLVAAASAAQPIWQAKDLNSVTFHKAPGHEPVVLVKDGKPAAVIVSYVKPLQGSGLQRKANRVMRRMISELQGAIVQSTGARLPVLDGNTQTPAAGQAAIVLGDCAEAAAIGLVGSKMPVEGFAIKTAANRVFIVGNDGEVPPEGSSVISKGTAWGVAEFLERYVGVRWYWPASRNGRSLVKQETLVIPPAHLTDAPVFRYRMIWPDIEFPSTGKGLLLRPQHVVLRTDISWPHIIRHHYTNGDYFRRVGIDVPSATRGRMFEYDDELLNVYLKEMARHFDEGKPLRLPHVGKTITVSPWDNDIGRHGKHQKLWQTDATAFSSGAWGVNGGKYGAASVVLTNFVQRLARAAQRRWPDVTIGYYATMNYTLAPDGYRFGGNVDVLVDNMDGLAMFKEAEVREREQANIDRWREVSGRKVQTWFHIYRPMNDTEAPYEFPNVIQRFYKANRDKINGSFVTGHDDYWPRHHISLYVWLKCLWNPDIDVKSVLDEYCRRLYGPAAATMRQLVQLKIDRWEKPRWSSPRVSPKAVYEQSYPPRVIDEMKALIRRARREAGDDEMVTKRIDYFTSQMPAFYKEADSYRKGGLAPLIVRRAEKPPVIDGKLDDAAWSRAEPVTFVVRGAPTDRKPPRYPTTLKAVWTDAGVTFAFDMVEPTPDKLTASTSPENRDDYLMWWRDDNVEIYLDVTGRNEGMFYQSIVTPAGAIYDLRMGDATWDMQGQQIGIRRGERAWTLEIFLPFDTFDGAVRPTRTEQVVWYGQFTRHRVGAARKKDGTFVEDTRLNNRFGFNANLMDFTRIVFKR